MKYFMLMIGFWCLNIFSIQAQNHQYRCKNFERQGLWEYIEINVDIMSGYVSVYYWTNENAQKQSLQLKSAEYVEPLQVSFENSEAIYEISYNENALSCIHPTGITQEFNRLPDVYSSENFEESGITEFLEYIDGNSLIYYTSRNIENKIYLDNVYIEELNNQVLYRFPGDNEIYIIYPQHRSLQCLHPTGKNQYFSEHQWGKIIK